MPTRYSLDMQEMTELIVTRQLKAPRSAVWAAFREPEIIAEWWGPAGWSVREGSIVLEPKVGGRHELDLHPQQDPSHHVPLRAIITEYEEYELFASADGPHEMTLDLVINTRVTLKEFGGLTHLTLTQWPLPNEVLAASTAAWNSALDKLETLLAEYF